MGILPVRPDQEEPQMNADERGSNAMRSRGTQLVGDTAGSKLQNRFGLLPGHAAEVVEKRGQVVSVLEVVKEGLDGYARAAEDRRAAELVGDYRDEWEPGTLAWESFHAGISRRVTVLEVFGQLYDSTESQWQVYWDHFRWNGW